MSSPVEIRMYASKFTWDDFLKNRQSIPGPNGVHYNVATLQFRYKYRLVEAGKNSLEWSEWANVPFVMEGDGANDGKEAA